MPIHEVCASWWVGAAVKASLVMVTPEGVSFIGQPAKLTSCFQCAASCGVCSIL